MAGHVLAVIGAQHRRLSAGPVWALLRIAVRVLPELDSAALTLDGGERLL